MRLPWPNLTFGEMSLNAQIIVGFDFGYDGDAIYLIFISDLN